MLAGVGVGVGVGVLHSYLRISAALTKRGIGALVKSHISELSGEQWSGIYASLYLETDMANRKHALNRTLI